MVRKPNASSVESQSAEWVTIPQFWLVGSSAALIVAPWSLITTSSVPASMPWTSMSFSSPSAAV